VAAPAGPIRITGLRELVRDFGRMQRGLRTELQREMSQIGGIVAGEARQIAQQKGLRDSGDLIRSIRPRVRGAVALVRSSAEHRGFNYPARLEYEHGGRRAFLGPAVDAKQAEVVDAIDDMLDRLASEHGFGRGGLL
jgi:hypothetical protein